MSSAEAVLELPFDVRPDPDEFVRAAMRWHFSSETGSQFWLSRAAQLEFDPLTDVREFADLALFPDMSGDLRHARVEDLIPRGCGAAPEIVGIYESGGTTGAPKRILLLQEWLDQLIPWSSHQLDAHGFPRNVNWLCAIPSGPHMIGEVIKRQTAYRGGMTFAIDLDPRWVKRLISGAKTEEAVAYSDHIVEQIAYVLRTQDVGVLMTTPPILERLSRSDEMVDLINEKVHAINWAGTQMDADTRYLYRTEVFPKAVLYGGYGSTLILGNASERPGLGSDDPCIYDPFSPYMGLSVVDPDTAEPVARGERGQVVMSHVSKSLLLPNVLERDRATRVAPLDGQIGDSVADIAPVQEFGAQTVVEGVY